MVIQPIADRIVVKREETKTASPGGIVLPEKSKERPLRGTVIAHGPKVTQTYTGMDILFTKYAGTEVDLNGEKVLIMTENEVLGVIQ